MAGIYIHIPFCRTKCIYCDFYSIAPRGMEADYVAALIAECRMRCDELKGDPVRTLYIGGGTPSLLPPHLLQQLITGIADAVSLSSVEEFTIEVNPDDITADYVAKLCHIGVNRISMGVQSFIDDELQTINRRHNARQAIEAVAAIRRAGISNISIDLIYGLPGQSVTSWQQSLSQAIALKVPHLSCYNLSYEEGTRLHRMRESGTITECPDDDCIAMYNLMSRRLRDNGYDHYEVSNFALPSMHSRHNSSYWTGDIYLGLGAAAHSFDGNATRSFNIANTRRYITSISAGTLACERETATLHERFDEYVMIHLRTSRGISEAEVLRLFGEPFLAHLNREARPFLARDLLSHTDGTYRLTDSAIMLSDSIIRTLML